MSIRIGNYNTLKVTERTPDGYLLEGDIPLHRLDASPHTREGDDVRVFLFHNRDGRVIATTKQPRGIAGDIVKLRVTDATDNGAFLDWGMPKDLFLPRSLQEGQALEAGDYCLVKILVDDKTGKILATEKSEHLFSNEQLTVKEMQQVELVVYCKTDLGYQVIINNKHLGLMHYNEVFRPLEMGDQLSGFVKKIKEDKIDIMAGRPGHTRVIDESERILDLLRQNGGFMPYHDKSDPEQIYEVFGMSKKTFKMTVGTLYRRKKLLIEPDGIRLNP